MDCVSAVSEASGEGEKEPPARRGLNGTLYCNRSFFDYFIISLTVSLVASTQIW